MKDVSLLERKGKLSGGGGEERPREKKKDRDRTTRIPGCTVSFQPAGQGVCCEPWQHNFSPPSVLCAQVHTASLWAWFLTHFVWHSNTTFSNMSMGRASIRFLGIPSANLVLKSTALWVCGPINPGWNGGILGDILRLHQEVKIRMM